uniref:ATP-dependent DNA helicase n=1 Tax=Culicoides sonorensis TaxID=179676 RepID=A0A336LU24_CULSO
MDPFEDDDMDDIDFSEIPTGPPQDHMTVTKSQSNGPSQPYLDILKKYFGHDSFRPMQWRIIESVISGRDNFAVMATGYGKSLCFQYPAIFMEGVAIVVSPLISLMEDQVLALTVSNIPACFLGSAQSDRQVLFDVFEKKYRIVYVTPEYITGDSGDQLLERLGEDLKLVAIDEAHCVSQWGHDFRPAYRKLNTLRRKIPGVPLLAVTATATISVRDDIIKILQLRNPLMSCSGFDRPNLEFHVHLKSEHGPWTDLRNHVRGNLLGSIIIYCLTRKQTEEIAGILQSYGVKCEAYHAGLSVKQRRSVHEKFVRDQVQIICATIAFGMGIDKPDVRMVIHYGASKDIESYYQEVGRAGRDGQPAKCIMYYNRGDFATHNNLRELSHMSSECKKNLEKLSEKMWDYLNTRDCRRLFILRYFERNDVKCDKRKNCCDNCDRNMKPFKDCDNYQGIDSEGLYDFSSDAAKLMKLVQLYKGQKGLNASVLALRGSKAQSVPEYVQKHELYGTGKDKPEQWWKSLALLLEREGMLKKESINFGGNTKFRIPMQRTFVTPKGLNWLQSKSTSLKLTPTTEMFSMLKPKVVLTSQPSSSNQISAPSTSGSFNQNNNMKLKQEIIQALLQKRSEIATIRDCMPHMIASNSALYKMADLKPLNLDEFRAAKLDGFNEAKIVAFGPKFLKVIQQKLNYLPSKENETPYNNKTENSEPVTPKNPKKDMKQGIKTPEQMMLDDGEDDLLLAGAAEIESKINKVSNQNVEESSVPENDCFDDDDESLNLQLVENLERIEREAGIESLPKSQPDSLSSRRSSNIDLNQFEAKKQKVKNFCPVKYESDKFCQDG